MVRRTALVAALAILLTACHTGAGGSATRSSPATAPPTSAPAPVGAAVPTTQGCEPLHGITSARVSDGPATPAFLVDASAGEVGCLDTVTFSLRSIGDGTPPGYDVRYVDPAKDPFLDGDPPVAVSLPGAAFLRVTIRPAHSVDLSKPDHPHTYLGDLSLRYGDHHHLQIVRELPDGPDSIVWVIGLDGTRPFVVDRAENPPRVTVYIG